MARAILAFFAICLVGPYAAQAQVLSYEEILENLSGVWAIPFSDKEDADLETDCAQLHINIQIEDRDGTLYYVAQHGGSEASGTPPHEQIVKQAIHTDGRVLHALHISYENERRLDDDGNPISWYLFMLSQDEFTWTAAHNDLKGFTPIRTRCDLPPNVS